MTLGSKRIVAFLVVVASLLLSGCEPEENAQREADTSPVVEYLEKESIMVGQPLEFYGQNFLTPEEGTTYLVFNGIFYVEDGLGDVTPRPIKNLRVSPIYDGDFPDGAEFGERALRSGTRALRWNRFGPFENPFSEMGVESGTFKGDLTAVNKYLTGEEEEGETLEITLVVEPSLVIRKLEPVLGMNPDGTLRTADCGEPALRAIGGLPYMIEVEVFDFEPEYFIYEITGINGDPDWTKFTHQADGPVDRLGDPTWPTYIPNTPEGMNQEIVVFNPLLDDEQIGRRLSSIRITAVNAAGDAMYTALPLSVVRPLQFNYDGNRVLAERYEPVPVYGPVIGSIGTTLTYSESESESRQNGVSVTLNESFTKSKGLSSSENWSEGVSEGETLSVSNAAGVVHSESENTSDTYGLSYNSSSANSESISTSNGTNWGWNTNEGQTSEESQTSTQDMYGELSGSTTVGASAEGSVPGLAKAGGKVETSVGAKVGAKQGEAVGKKNGNSSSYGEHMYGSQNDTEAFGSVTTDSEGSSVSGTYALGSQSSISNNTTESEATSKNVSFQMGGSASVVDSESESHSETWGETWVNTSSNSTLLSYSSKIPNGKCAYVFRQTVRYARTAQLYSFDMCGVRSVVGETVFNEWSWNPNITITEKEQCDAGVPPADMAAAECFFACE